MLNHFVEFLNSLYQIFNYDCKECKRDTIYIYDFGGYDFMKKTKNICSIGPSTQNWEAFKGIVEAGMNVARIKY